MGSHMRKGLAEAMQAEVVQEGQVQQSQMLSHVEGAHWIWHILSANRHLSLKHGSQITACGQQEDKGESTEKPGVWGQAPLPKQDIVTFSRGQHAVHAVGGCCKLREAWVPAFQDIGSVNIPAIRKHESGLLRTVHLSPWPRSPVSTRDLDRPENEVSV